LDDVRSAPNTATYARCVVRVLSAFAGNGFDVATGSPGRMPVSSLRAGDGVDAVVRDDAEVVIALHDVGHRPVLTGPRR
jgi:hypothetical protein